MTYEAPKRFTATNDVTGALIKSKTDNHEAYANGYEILKNGVAQVNNYPETKFPIRGRVSKKVLADLEHYVIDNNTTIEDVVELALIDYFK